MKVWRIEDADGIGLHSKIVGHYDEDKDLITPTAFNIAVYSDWCQFDDDLMAHVPPEKDSLLQESLKKEGVRIEDYIFGFETPRKMRDYLYKDSWIKVLNEYDMQVALYWVEQGIIMGNSQVLIPKNLKPLEKTRIAEYFGIK